jgi:ornithine cyclodeaminase
MWLPGNTGALVTMPAYLGHTGTLGLKVITYFAGNRGTDLDTHQGAVMLFDSANGGLLAILDATQITAIRTAAVSAVATRLLARPGAATLAILGSGTQAHSHLEAMLLARPIREVRIWSRNPKNAHAFAAEQPNRTQVSLEAVASAAEAVRGAGVICTTTSSLEPVLRGEWLEPGMHINAVGSSIPFARELDTAAVVRSKMFVDRRESALHESGDFLIPKQEGALDDRHIRAEIGEVLAGMAEGRAGDGEVTLFKSLGLAIEDLAAAQHIYHAARERGMGSQVDLGGHR